MVKSYLTDFRSERFEFQQVIQIQAGISKKAGVGPGKDSRRPKQIGGGIGCMKTPLTPTV